MSAKEGLRGREGARDGRGQGRKMGGWRVWKQVFNSKDFVSIPPFQGTLEAWEEAKLMWDHSRFTPEPQLLLTTTTALVVESKVPHVHPPGTTLPRTSMSVSHAVTPSPTWPVNLADSHSDPEDSRVFPGILFSQKLPAEGQCILLQNAKLQANSDHVFFGGHKSTSPLFCFILFF